MATKKRMVTQKHTRHRRAKQSSTPSIVGAVVVALLLAGYLAAQRPALAAAGGMAALVAAGAAGAARWWLGRRQREGRLARLRTLNDLLALTPTQFELAVADLLRAQGYRDVRHTGGGGDLAADLTCVSPQGKRGVVQCKRYAPGNVVGSPEIQKFIGMITVHHHAELGIFVTTSSYTQPALALGRQHHLWMLDGQELAALLARTRAHASPHARSA